MPKPPIRKPKKKANPLLAAKIDYIDYKDTNLLRKFISDRGKIRARRVTGVTLAAAAPDRQGDQERPRDGAAALHLDRSLSEDGRMKLILTREVAGLGLAGDIVEVADGYGRNFLVPRGAAIAWTKGAEKQIAQIKRARDAREIRDLGHAREIKADLEKLSVSLGARAGEDGRLFGSVTTADIAARGQGRRRPAAGPQAHPARPATSRRPARTPSPSTCTRTSSRRCR